MGRLPGVSVTGTVDLGLVMTFVHFASPKFILQNHMPYDCLCMDIMTLRMLKSVVLPIMDGPEVIQRKSYLPYDFVCMTLRRPVEPFSSPGGCMYSPLRPE